MTRQPVHTFYGGADRFRFDTPSKMGGLALRALEAHGPIPGLSPAIHHGIAEKLALEPIEDLRIDFEDGYGYRPDAEEDAHAQQAAEHLQRAADAGTLPPSIGIRIKPMGTRALRTLAHFTGLPLPLLVTLPKVTQPGQVTALLNALPPHFDLEIMAETPESLRNLTALTGAAQGRCRAVHFGAYDYTAALGIAAAHQRLDHPACDHARSIMQLALAGTPIHLSDGAYTHLPIGDTPQVREAWTLHYHQIRRALSLGFYQGWDLHPAQLPARYAAVFAFFAGALPDATARLKNFLAEAAQATRIGAHFDDAATGQGLLNFFLRGLGCGALAESQVLAAGLTPAELQTASIPQIIEGRR